MNTHESYVSIETAKLLKEAGFDWYCEMVYCNDDPAIIDNSHCPCNWNSCDNNYSAPTLSVAQKWLRDTKTHDVYVFPTTNIKRENVYQYGIKCPKGTLWVPGQPSTAMYDTYEESFEEGIKKCLTIILNEKK